MQLTKLYEREERGDLITKQKLMNNLEERQKDLIMKIKGGQIFEGTKNCKRIFA